MGVRGVSRTAKLVVGAVVATLALVLPAPASAIHLFPLTPAFDPLGHDCAQALGTAPEETGAGVSVFGFGFVDGETNTSTTTVSAGESVTWTWLADHCHSVTFGDGSGSYGAEGFQPANQPQLVRHGDGGDSFSLVFDEPGTYQYLCVHHAGVGMRGTVVVSDY